MKNTLLIFYAEGMYDSAAYAIREYCKRNGEELEVVLAEECRYTNFGMAQFRRAFYKVTARSFPFVNGLSGNIRQTDKWLSRSRKRAQGEEESAQDPNMPVWKSKLYRVDNVIARFDPSVILCLTPKSHKRVLIARARMKKNFPVFALMTDYCLNRNFLQANTDGYLVQNGILAQAMLNKGIEENKIHVVGTPVETAKLRMCDVDPIKHTFGLDNGLPVVTLIGGRYGSDILKKCFAVLCEYCDKLNLLVLTDGSVGMNSYITNICKGKKIESNVVLVDRVEDIANVYSVTDILVTAPTAAVTAEAVCRRLPFVLLKDMNAIEKGNLDYLTTHGYGLRGCTPDEIVSSVLNLLNDNEYYAARKEKLAQSDLLATQRVVDFLSDQAEQYRLQEPHSIRNGEHQQLALDLGEHHPQ